VIVVVDAAAVMERAADRRLTDTILRQLVAADLLVLSKLDLVPDRTAVRAWLGPRTSAPVLEAHHGDVPLDLLFGLDRVGRAAADPTAAGQLAAGFASRSYEWLEPVERQTVIDMLSDGRLLRAKGILQFVDAAGRRSVLHQVGRRLQITDEGPWEGGASRLVMLGLTPVLGSLPTEETRWPAG
jgi:G3E family GTPase